VARTDLSTLREEAAKAVERGKERRDAGDIAGAINAFEHAVERYASAGMLVSAIGACKLILQLDPHREAIAARLAELGGGGRPATVPHVRVPEGRAIDSVALGAVVPGARRDDTADGVTVIPLDDDLPEIEIIEGSDRHSAIDRAIDAVQPSDAAILLVPARAALDPDARRALETTPLLAGLPPRALEALIARLALVELGAGEVLFREGDPGACLYVVSAGEIVVESGGRDLARLGPGGFVGEIALVTDLPRSATVRADAPAALLAIDREVVREVIDAHPQVLGQLLRFVRDRLVDRVTRTGELFRLFDDAERAALSSRFELVEVDPGASLIVQGRRADGLFVVLAGRAEVWRDGDVAALAALGPGEVFGEMSMLGGGGSMAHVRAATRVLALRMAARTFQEVIMTHPQVLAYIGELAARRAPRPQTAEEIVDLHLDLL